MFYILTQDDFVSYFKMFTGGMEIIRLYIWPRLNSVDGFTEKYIGRKRLIHLDELLASIDEVFREGLSDYTLETVNDDEYVGEESEEFMLELHRVTPYVLIIIYTILYMGIRCDEIVLRIRNKLDENIFMYPLNLVYDELISKILKNNHKEFFIYVSESKNNFEIYLNMDSPTFKEGSIGKMGNKYFFDRNEIFILDKELKQID